MATREIRISDIALDESTQARAGLHEEAVGDYRGLMERGVDLPPVSLVYDGEKHYLVDGFHRLQAAIDLKRKKIRAEVQKGTREGAAWLACAANQTHGARRTRADLRVAIQTALALRPKASNLAVARHVGVSDKTVKVVRSEMEGRSENTNEPTTRTDTKGRRQPAAKPRHPKPTAPTDADYDEAQRQAEQQQEQRQPDPVYEIIDIDAFNTASPATQARAVELLTAQWLANKGRAA